MLRPFTLLIGLAAMAAISGPAAAQAPQAMAPNVPAAPAARDPASDLAYWNAVQAADNCDAARSYIQYFPNGVFVELARLAERRLCGSSRAIMVIPTAPALVPAPPPPPAAMLPPPPPPVAQPAPPPAVAVLPPPSTQEPPAPVEVDEFTVVRNMQLELHRLGCASSNVDGRWGPTMRTAITKFNRYAKASLDPNTPSSSAIAALREHEERVCPLECGRGYRERDGACVAIEAPPRVKREREARRPPPDQQPRRLNASPAPAMAPPPARAQASPRPQFSSPLCESRIQVGGKWCCTHDPPRGPSIIICN